MANNPVNNAFFETAGPGWSDDGSGRSNEDRLDAFKRVWAEVMDQECVEAPVKPRANKSNGLTRASLDVDNRDDRQAVREAMGLPNMVDKDAMTACVLFSTGESAKRRADLTAEALRGLIDHYIWRSAGRYNTVQIWDPYSVRDEDQPFTREWWVEKGCPDLFIGVVMVNESYWALAAVNVGLNFAVYWDIGENADQALPSINTKFRCLTEFGLEFHRERFELQGNERVPLWHSGYVVAIQMQRLLWAEKLDFAWIPTMVTKPRPSADGRYPSGNMAPKIWRNLAKEWFGAGQRLEKITPRSFATYLEQPNISAQPQQQSGVTRQVAIETAPDWSIGHTVGSHASPHSIESDLDILIMGSRPSLHNPSWATSQAATSQRARQDDVASNQIYEIPPWPSPRHSAEEAVAPPPTADEPTPTAATIEQPAPSPAPPRRRQRQRTARRAAQPAIDTGRSQAQVPRRRNPTARQTRARARATAGRTTRRRRGRVPAGQETPYMI